MGTSKLRLVFVYIYIYIYIMTSYMWPNAGR